jgi:hypothetical protein
LARVTALVPVEMFHEATESTPGRLVCALIWSVLADALKWSVVEELIITYCALPGVVKTVAFVLMTAFGTRSSV